MFTLTTVPIVVGAGEGGAVHEMVKSSRKGGEESEVAEAVGEAETEAEEALIFLSLKSSQNCFGMSGGHS